MATFLLPQSVWSWLDRHSKLDRKMGDHGGGSTIHDPVNAKVWEPNSLMLSMIKRRKKASRNGAVLVHIPMWQLIQIVIVINAYYRPYYLLLEIKLVTCVPMRRYW